MVTKARDRRWEELEKGRTSLERLIKHFEAYNRSEGESPRTVDYYTKVLTYYREYLEAQGYSTNLEALTKEVAREFVLHLQTRPKWVGHKNGSSTNGNLSPVSVQTYVRGIRAFFSWLHREGYTEENVLASLKLPKAPRKLIDVLTDEELARILACMDTNTASGCRDTAMIVVYLDSGLRLSELLGLKLADAHIDQCYLKVMGKGAKERIVPIGSLAQRILQRYIYHFRPEPLYNDHDYVFLTLDGKPLSANALKLVFTRLARKSGVKRFHAHLCRHTFASRYLANGGNIFFLQQILGHTSLEMVRRYVTVASEQVAAQHMKFSPMDRMHAVRLKALKKPKRRNGSHKG
jgi:integrase/recombinase XerC/integrase/recombinase XerD